MDVSDEDDEDLEPPNQLTRGTLTAIGNITVYRACPAKSCHFSKLLEDGRCRICHTKPDSAADGLVANMGIKMRGTGDIQTMKIFTATLQTFYRSVRPGCSLQGDGDHIEDLLWELLPLEVDFRTNTSTPPCLTQLVAAT